jgi:hypothetical protein
MNRTRSGVPNQALLIGRTGHSKTAGTYPAVRLPHSIDQIRDAYAQRCLRSAWTRREIFQGSCREQVTYVAPPTGPSRRVRCLLNGLTQLQADRFTMQSYLHKYGTK